jgi:hypothetical protein
MISDLNITGHLILNSSQWVINSAIRREPDSARGPMSQTRPRVGRHSHTCVVKLIRARLLAEPDSYVYGPPYKEQTSCSNCLGSAAAPVWRNSTDSWVNKIIPRTQGPHAFVAVFYNSLSSLQSRFTLELPGSEVLKEPTFRKNMFGLLFNHEDLGQAPPKCRFIFNRLHGVICQTTELKYGWLKTWAHISLRPYYGHLYYDTVQSSG